MPARQPAGWPAARTPLARTSPQPALFPARATPSMKQCIWHRISDRHMFFENLIESQRNTYSITHAH